MEGPCSVLLGHSVGYNSLDGRDDGHSQLRRLVVEDVPPRSCRPWVILRWAAIGSHTLCFWLLLKFMCNFMYSEGLDFSFNHVGRR
jgi:hypothetical protein